VDTKIVDVRPGDTFLLCSDGLNGELDDAEIAAVLCSTPRPVAAVEQLLDLAIVKGGRDNVTVVLVCLEAPPADRLVG
jgi:serine/threonine protein phosphatase PrpC